MSARVPPAQGWAAAVEAWRPRAVRIRAACVGGCSAVRVKMGPGHRWVGAVAGSIRVARRAVAAGCERKDTS
eukprot:2169643-Prymnesium_polylepis.1